MEPKRAANQLTSVWRLVNEGGPVLPIDAASVAEALGLLVLEEDLEPQFMAALLIGAARRAIVINRQMRNSGRRNFSIAHELGHNSLHAHRQELRCTWKDLTDHDPHPKNIEREANEFASTFLMPADDVREQLRGRPISLSTADGLRHRYNTSLTAMAIRMVQITEQAAALVFVKDGRIDRSVWNRAMKWPVRRGASVEAESSLQPVTVDSDLWLAPRYGSYDGRLYASMLDTTYDGTSVALLWAR